MTAPAFMAPWVSAPVSVAPGVTEPASLAWAVSENILHVLSPIIPVSWRTTPKSIVNFGTDSSEEGPTKFFQILQIFSELLEYFFRNKYFLVYLIQ